MVNPLAHLDAKDWFTLAGTTVALVFSTASLLQKRAESRLAVRKQLSEILTKLADLNFAITKARVAEDESGKPDRTLGALHDQRRYLVRQASYLADTLVEGVSTHEHLMIAAAFDAADDTWQAERCYRIAASQQADPVSSGLAQRAFARFLYHEGDKSSGRDMYQRAIATFGADGDRARWRHRCAPHQRSRIRGRRAGSRHGVVLA